MPSQRDLLAALKRDELLEALDAYGLEVADRRVRDQILDALLDFRSFQLDEWLANFSRDRLKELCRDLGLDDSGRAKADIVERLAPGKEGSALPKRVVPEEAVIPPNLGGGSPPHIPEASPWALR